MNRTHLALVSLFLLTLTGVQAQTVTARLEGTVLDSTGAVVPGAAISARDVQTQVHNELTSDAQGHFTFPSLKPGMYTLTIIATGFQKQIITKLELNAAAIENQIVHLQVGQATESVSINASEETVQTTDSQVGRTINLRDIETLPQLGRSPLTLSTFQPGAQIDPGDATFTHINGQRQGSNNTTLDGIDANDSSVPRLGLSLTAINTDSISEFRMITDGGKAEYGRNAGGQVQLITRSGSNQVHGAAFEFLRNTVLNANNFFSNSSGTLRPKFIQNIFGFDLGGPVVLPKIYNGHNKTFIFGNYQGRRTAQEVVRNRTVLTSDAKKGLFDYNVNGVRQQVNILALDPRKIGIDPAVAKTLALLPDPNNNDLGDGLETAGFRFNNPVKGLEDQFTIKGDHNINDNQHLFLRWSWQRNSSTDNLNNADATFPGQIQGTQGGHRWGFSAGYDWNITTRTVNEFRAGHQSASTAFLRPARLQGPTLISNDYTDPFLANFAQGRNSPVNQFTDNLTHVKGKHTIKGGATFEFTNQFGYNEAGIYPNVSFTTGNGNAPPASLTPAGITGANLTNFQNLYNELLGRVSSVTQTFYSNLREFQGPGTPRVRNFLINDIGYYVQDDWRITRRLTVNYGLRYDVFGSPHEKNGLQGSLVEAETVAMGIPLQSTSVLPVKRYYKVDYNNFAPRFGFAYDVMGDGKTAIRGNYGIFFDRTLGASISSADGGTPGFSQALTVFPNSVAGSDVRVSDNLAAILPKQPGAPSLTLAATRSTSLTLYNPNLRSGYLQQYGLNIQRQIMRNTILEVGYVGSRGVKLFLQRDLNQQQVYGEFLNAFKEYQAYVPTGTATGPVPSANNVITRIFGTPAAALSAVGASNFTNGVLSAAATAIDRTNYPKYPAAGIADNYLRKYPQYNQLFLGTNDGRNYYDSLQASIRRSSGSLHMAANYTFSKSLDNTSAEGNGNTTQIDSYNLRLNKGVSDYNHPHSFNGTASYTLPIGRGKRFGGGMNRFADALIGGWDIGTLLIWQSGSPFSVLGGYATGPAAVTSYALFSGSDRGLGSVTRQGNGVFYLSQAEIAQFGFNRTPGYIGNAGRNAFIGPRYFNEDASLVKHFKITEKHAVTFRAEAYNLFNNASFNVPGTNLLTPASFGKISSTTGAARILQGALRYDF